LHDEVLGRGHTVLRRSRAAGGEAPPNATQGLRIRGLHRVAETIRCRPAPELNQDFARIARRPKPTSGQVAVAVTTGSGRSGAPAPARRSGSPPGRSRPGSRALLRAFAAP